MLLANFEHSFVAAGVSNVHFRNVLSQKIFGWPGNGLLAHMSVLDVPALHFYEQMPACSGSADGLPYDVTLPMNVCQTPCGSNSISDLSVGHRVKTTELLGYQTGDRMRLCRSWVVKAV